MSNENPERATAHFTDEEIAVVIDHYDDPEHPDALSVSDVRSLLSELQHSIETRWETYTGEIRAGDLEVISDTSGAVVLDDPDRRKWVALLDGIDCFDEVDRTILRVTHHQAAQRLTGLDFDGTDPVVVRKPPDAEAGQQFVEAVIDSLLRQGVRPKEAWAYYGIDIRGYDGREWMERCGFEDRVSVADAVETARDTLGK